MPVNIRTVAHCIIPRTAFALVLMSGCGTQEPPASSPGPTAQPAPVTPGPTAQPVPSPAQDLKDIKEELKDIKKDVTPPVIIKPDLPTAPAAEPRKTA
jgi:hypothetical protein